MGKLAFFRNLIIKLKHWIGAAFGKLHQFFSFLAKQFVDLTKRMILLSTRAFETFAIWFDPFLLKLITNTSGIQSVIGRASQWAASNGRLAFKKMKAVASWPFTRLRIAFTHIFGEISISFKPAEPVQTLVGAKREIGNAASTQLESIKHSIDRFKKQKPAVFRTASVFAMSFLMILGSCSTFQFFKSITKASVKVSGPEFRKAIDSHQPAPVFVRFSKPAVKLEMIGKSPKIEMRPAVSGTWRFLDDTSLAFYPASHWLPDESYSFTIPREAISPEIDLASYEQEFETPKFRGRVVSSSFYIDPKDPTIKKGIVTLDFSHPIDNVSLDERVSFVYSNSKLGLSDKPISFKITMDETETIAYIHSDIVSIQDDEGQLEFLLKSGVRAKTKQGSASKLVATINVPGRYSHFQIADSKLQLVRNEFYELDQVLFLETTGSIEGTELQKNMIVYQLPKDKPAAPGTKAEKDYKWRDPSEVGPEILAKSRKVEINLVAGENIDQQIHAFRMEVTEGSYVYTQVRKGTKGIGGFVLKESYNRISKAPDFERETRILHDGAILSLAGEKKISVMSYDNDEVEFEVGRILPDQINHLISQSGGNFNSPYFYNYNFNEDNISEKVIEVKQLNRTDDKRLQYASFDFTKYLSEKGPRLRNGLFYLKVRGKRKKEQVKKPSEESEESSEDSDYENEEEEYPRYRAKNEDKRLVLVTDLGILVKESSNGERDVFVQSFSKGEPVDDVKIQVIGKNGITIATQTTDNQGHAKLPNLADFKREKTPTAFLAQVGSDLSFMPFEREDRKLDYSRFEVGGLEGADQRDRLSAFIFSDRGIYRPGDEIRAGLVIKSGDWTRSLKGLPVQISIFDARGLEVSTRMIKLSAQAFEEIKYKTEETSPTGVYEIRASLVSTKGTITYLGSGRVRVEEFLPDRLRIQARFSNQVSEAEGWIKPKGLKGIVQLMNLYGTPAQKKQVQGILMLQPRFPSFKGYEDYRFYDALRTNRSFREELGSLATDDDGKVQFNLPMDQFDKGIYWVTFHADGFEAEGGRAVSSQSMQIVSPLDYVVGLKTDGDLSYINLGSSRSIHLIAIDSKLSKISAQTLKLKLVERRYVSSLVKRNDGVYEYKSVEKEIPIEFKDLPIPSVGLTQILKTDKAGDFVLSILDDAGVEQNRVEYTVVGQGNITRSLERNAELSLKLKGKDFAQGQNIELSVRAPYTGAGLITIEKDKVYAHRWFKSTTESSVQSIRLPSGIEGNGYVNVSFVRALDSQAIYASPLSYGVAPFSVSRKNRTANIKLEAPPEIRPGDNLRIRYNSDRQGKIVIYAVDEGILQVAKYQKPDPLGHFFQKRALEVRTMQIVDQLLPEFSIIQRLSKTGGDADSLLGMNLNPFKKKRQQPVAFWSGLLEADATTREAVYQVPDYFNGKIKIYAFFVNEGALGVTETSTVVRGDFILSPTVPNFASPSDEIEISVNVTNNVRDSGVDLPVQVELKTEGGLSIISDTTQNLAISEKGEKTAKFRIKATTLGEGKVILTATGKEKSATQTSSLSIRPSTPYITDVTSGFILSDSAEIEINRTLSPEFRKIEISASPLPLAFSNGFFTYLQNYPYGCTEQLTSRGMAAMVLKSQNQLGLAPADLDEMITLSFKVLQSRQNAEGAFGFWAANSYVSPFQTVYALQFLTEAKERGIAIPDSTMKRGLSYLDSMLSGRAASQSSLQDRSFAAYVLARNGLLRTNEINSLLMEAKRSKDENVRLATMYLASTRKIMRQDKEAEDLFRKSQPSFLERIFSDDYDPVSGNSRYIYLLGKHFPGNFDELSGKSLEGFLTPLRQGQFNTISASLSVLAIDTYIDLRKAKKMELTVSQELGDNQLQPIALPDSLFSKASVSPDAKKVYFKNRTPAPAFYQLTIAGFDTTPPKPIANGIEVSREFRDSDGNTLQKIEVGKDVFVHIRLRAEDRKSISNIAIVDLLPGGLEVVLESARSNQGESNEGFTLPGLVASKMKTDYVDIRDDRVLVFASAGSSASEYVYKTRAINVGKFSVPPLFAEAMYDKSIRAITNSGELEIISKRQ